MCHNRPSAALLTPFGFGHIPVYAPFSLSLSVLQLTYSYKPKRVCQNAKFLAHPPCYIQYFDVSVSASEDAEQEEEEVDEVKVEIKGSHSGQLVSCGAGEIGVIGKLLHLLGVPCCETDKDGHAGQ